MMHEGILPVSKPSSKTSFYLVSLLRKLTGIRTIGHAGTLDPFANGVMILLIGRRFTRLSSQFLNQDKGYLATVHLGITTDTHDLDGQIIVRSDRIPSLADIDAALARFQGTTLQTPPMFSAKKIAGKKLYELARAGMTVERNPVPVTIQIERLDYTYPTLTLSISCSKGTYIRSLAHDLGVVLGCGAHLSALTRTRSGAITLQECCEGRRLIESDYDWISFLKQEIPCASDHKS